MSIYILYLYYYFIQQPTSDEKIIFKHQNDFDTADDYANYVKYAIEEGMVVCCCREYESISVGCEGKVIQVIKEGGLHDLNVKVFFNLMKSTFNLMIKIK